MTYDIIFVFNQDCAQIDSQLSGNSSWTCRRLQNNTTIAFFPEQPDRRGCHSSILDNLSSLEELLAAVTSLGREPTGGELLQVIDKLVTGDTVPSSPSSFPVKYSLQLFDFVVGTDLPWLEVPYWEEGGLAPRTYKEDAGLAPRTYREDAGLAPRTYREEAGLGLRTYREEAGLAPRTYRAEVGLAPPRFYREEGGLAPSTYRAKAGLAPRTYREEGDLAPRSKLWTRYVEAVKELLLTAALLTPFTFNGTNLRLEVGEPMGQFPSEAGEAESRIMLEWREDVERGGEHVVVMNGSQLFVGMLMRGGAAAAIFANSPETDTVRSLGTQLLHYSALGSADEQPELVSADIYLSSLGSTSALDLQCGIFRPFRDESYWVEQVCQPVVLQQIEEGGNQLLQCHCQGKWLHLQTDWGFGGIFKNNALQTSTTTTSTTTTVLLSTATTATTSAAFSSSSTETGSSTEGSTSATTTSGVEGSTATTMDPGCFATDQTPFIFTFVLLSLSLFAYLVVMVLHVMVLWPR